MIFSHYLWNLFSNRTRFCVVSEKKYFFPQKQNSAEEHFCAVSLCFVEG